MKQRAEWRETFAFISVATFDGWTRRLAAKLVDMSTRFEGRRGVPARRIWINNRKMSLIWIVMHGRDLLLATPQKDSLSEKHGQPAGSPRNPTWKTTCVVWPLKKEVGHLLFPNDSHLIWAPAVRLFPAWFEGRTSGRGRKPSHTLSLSQCCSSIRCSLQTSTRGTRTKLFRKNTWTVV